VRFPRPSPPKDAPPGTVSINEPIGWFSLSLQITDEDLQPSAITELLNVQPTSSQTKGLPLLREDGTVKRIPKFGRWTLQIKEADTDEWNVEEVVRSIFAGLPTEPNAWREVSALGRIHLSVGLSLTTNNQTFALSPDLITFLGERAIGLSFDVYGKEF
jgi:hypothetical protein